MFQYIKNILIVGHSKNVHNSDDVAEYDQLDTHKYCLVVKEQVTHRYLLYNYTHVI